MVIARSESPSPGRPTKRRSRGRSPVKRGGKSGRGSSSDSSSSGSGSSSSGSSRSGSSSSSSSGSSTSRSRSRSEKRTGTKPASKEKRKFAASRSRSPRRRRRSPSPLKPLKIHIGKLTRNVVKEHIQEIFSVYGNIRTAEVAIDRKINIPSGHAYVEYTESEFATKAEKYMNGGQIDGQEVTVRCVLPQRRRSPLRMRPRGGGGWMRGRSPPRFRGRRSPLRSPPRRRRSPMRRSPPRRRSRSRSGRRSPVSRRSRSPAGRRSPVGRRSRSPMGRRSRSPMGRRSRSPIGRRSRSPRRSPMRRKSRSRSSSR